MNGTFRNEIRIWKCSQAPEPLKLLVRDPSEWLAIVPAELASTEVEELFLRWHSDMHPVTRIRLADGSVVFAGAHPSNELFSIPGHLQATAEAHQQSGRTKGLR